MSIDGTHQRSTALLRTATITIALAAIAGALLLSYGASASPASSVRASGGVARAPRGICNRANVPCHFGTPSGNIRCVWTPAANSVACVLRSTGLAYRLRPRGSARTISLSLPGHGQRLHLNEQIVFPHSLSCHDTPRTMTCNQDFFLGAFTLAPSGSHRS
jgi:hypothetical protein